jgi:hypothetical protein
MNTNFERLLEPGCTDLPDCRCGKEMQFAHIVFLPNEATTHIRVYACASCKHQMRLTVWGSSEAGADAPGYMSKNEAGAVPVT